MLEKGSVTRDCLEVQKWCDWFGKIIKFLEKVIGRKLKTLKKWLKWFKKNKSSASMVIWYRKAVITNKKEKRKTWSNGTSSQINKETKKHDNRNLGKLLLKFLESRNRTRASLSPGYLWNGKGNNFDIKWKAKRLKK